MRGHEGPTLSGLRCFLKYLVRSVLQVMGLDNKEEWDKREKKTSETLLWGVYRKTQVGGNVMNLGVSHILCCLLSSVLYHLGAEAEKANCKDA